MRYYIFLFFLLAGLLLPAGPAIAAEKAPAEVTPAEKAAAPKPKEQSAAATTTATAATEKAQARKASGDAKKNAGKKAEPDKAAAAAAQAAKNAKEAEEKDLLEAAKKEEVVDPLDAVWAGQRSMLNDLGKSASSLNKRYTTQADALNERLKPLNEEARRLLALTNTFRKWPNPMEAVGRRISNSIQDVQGALEPMLQARAEVQNLLTRVNQLAESIPDEKSGAGVSQEMRAYAKEVGTARLLLTAVIGRYDSTLTPGQSLLQRLVKAQQDINTHVPVLWKEYYLQGPVAYLSPDAWENLGQQLDNILRGMQLRLPVEIPTTAEQWSASIMRCLVTLLFTGVVLMLMYRRWARNSTSPAIHHLFRVSLPWNCLGLALLTGSVHIGTGEFYRFFLALGNLCLIAGQILLAWDLRRLKFSEIERTRSPLWALMPLTFCAYALLYVPLIKPVVVITWGALLIFALLRNRKRIKPDISPMQLERSALDTESLILWLCLVPAMLGMHILSMAMYLLFVSCTLGLQLCLGGMALISRINEHIPNEGARAALAHFAVALAAPLVLVLAVVGESLWVATLPGGMYLLQDYIFRSVDVGTTRFNIIHILLIISVFYLTRTAVGMGTRFLGRLPAQGLQIDATLIPPMQTGFTYVMWCIFGLFTLRALGMELSNLAMVAGGLSVGIGFGMQTIVNNFLSGLILIFSRTLQAGDVVEVGTTTGRVRKISVRATMVETYDNALIYVPNSEFVASRLINWTRNSRTVRRQIMVGVAYGSDTALVIKVLLGVASANAGVLKYPAPTATFQEFGPSSLDFMLRFWVNDYDVGLSVASELRLEIEQQFRAHKIEMAFPQMDVHVKEVPPRVRAPESPRIKRSLLTLPPRQGQAALQTRHAQGAAPGSNGRRRPRRLVGRDVAVLATTGQATTAPAAHHAPDGLLEDDRT